MNASSPHFLVSRIACPPAATTCHRLGAACRYKVAWSINPHMRVGASDFGRAHREHDRFLSALREASAHATPLDFVHGAYDSVFAKDSAVLTESAGVRRALLASPVHAVRRREQDARAHALTDLGFGVRRCRAALEGGDVVMLPSGAAARGAFLGHGFRSTPAAADELAEFLAAEVTLLELVDPHLYHLDVALAVLEDGTALVCEEAFTAASLRRLRAHPAVTSIVSVPRAEALAFGVNLVEVGATVILGSRAPTVEAAVTARGYRVVHAPLTEFQLAGGSAACLVARVHSFDTEVSRQAAA